jgi:hypothetical protein
LTARVVALSQRRQLGPQRAGRHRGELVEHRLDQHRQDERQQHHQGRRAGRADRPPPARRQPGHRVEAQQRDGCDHRTDGVRLDQVDGPAGPALGGQPVLGEDPVPPGRERQGQQVGEQHHRQPAQQRLGHPVAAERPTGELHQPGTDRGETE